MADPAPLDLNAILEETYERGHSDGKASVHTPTLIPSPTRHVSDEEFTAFHDAHKREPRTDEMLVLMARTATAPRPGSIPAYGFGPPKVLKPR